MPYEEHQRDAAWRVRLQSAVSQCWRHNNDALSGLLHACETLLQAADARAAAKRHFEERVGAAELRAHLVLVHAVAFVEDTRSVTVVQLLAHETNASEIVQITSPRTKIYTIQSLDTPPVPWFISIVYSSSGLYRLITTDTANANFFATAKDSNWMLH